MSKHRVPKIEYVKITDVHDMSECKSIGQIIAEDLDQAIAKEIIQVFKKYFPNTKIDGKKVLRLARMLIDTESGDTK